MKKCALCNQEKDLNEFPKKGKNTYRGKCKICFYKTKKDLRDMTYEDKNIINENLKNIGLKRKEEKEQKRIMKIEMKKRKFLELEEIKKIKRMKICKICGEKNVDMFYPNKKSKCKKCTSLFQTNKYQLMNDTDKEGYKNKLKIWRKDNLIRVRVSGAKQRSIRKGIPFDITDEDIFQKLTEQDNKCYISKVPLSFNENDWYGMSLDRLDSNLGYTKENTIIVSKFVNISKNILSLDEYVKLMKEVCDNM